MPPFDSQFARSNDGCDVKASPKPEEWRLDQLFSLSFIMAVTVTGLQFLFLWFTSAALPIQGEYHDAACASISHWGAELGVAAECGSTDMNIFRLWFNDNIPQLQASQQQALMYISLSIAGMLTLMSARAHSFFWESLPGTHLLVAAALSIGVTVVLGGAIKSTAIEFQGASPHGNWDYIGVCILYNLFAFLVLDAVKVTTNMLMDKYMSGPDGANVQDQQVKEQQMEIRRQNRIVSAKSQSHRRALSSSSSGCNSDLITHQGSLVEGFTPKTTMPRPEGAHGPAGEEVDFTTSAVVANAESTIEAAREQFVRARTGVSISAARSSAVSTGKTSSALIDPLIHQVASLANVTERLVALQGDEEAARRMQIVPRLSTILEDSAEADMV